MHERTHHQTDASLICFFVCILCMIGETGSTQEKSKLWEFSQTGAFVSFHDIDMLENSFAQVSPLMIGPMAYAKPRSPVLESDVEPGCEKFVQLGAWENAYFATRSKSRQKSVNCIILTNLWNL